MASISTRREWIRLRPVALGPGSNGSSKVHSGSVRSERYPLPARAQHKMKNASSKASRRLHTPFSAGILGGVKRLADTEFCWLYRCVVQGQEPLPGGYTRSHLTLRSPIGTNQHFSEWNVFELVRGGTVIGVRWTEFFQDDFFYGATPTMVSQLSQAVVGMSLPANAIQTLINNALRRTPDASKGVFSAGNLMITAFARGAGNGGEFHLTLTSKVQWLGLQRIDPPRNKMTLDEQKKVVAQALERLGVFSRQAPTATWGTTAWQFH